MEYQELLPLFVPLPDHPVYQSYFQIISTNSIYLKIDKDTEQQTCDMCNIISVDFFDVLKHWGLTQHYPYVKREGWWEMIDKIGQWAVEEDVRHGYYPWNTGIGYEDSRLIERSIFVFQQRRQQLQYYCTGNILLT